MAQSNGILSRVLNKKPLNFNILDIKSPWMRNLPFVSTLDTFEGLSRNFNDAGLFSTVIFGRPGTPERDARFGRINLKLDVLHPKIYKTIVSLKSIYEGILLGTTYAVWDEQTHDFVESNVLEGQTGMTFFVDHLEKIVFKESKSTQRQDKIDLIAKSISEQNYMVNQFLILPAGLRDIELDEDGSMSQDEINDKYKRCIGLANTVPDRIDPTSTDHIRLQRSMQMVLNEIYDTIGSIIPGKGGLFRGKTASRNVHYGTRNVITAMDVSTRTFGTPGEPTINAANVGMMQAIKGIQPIANYHIRNGFLGKVFSDITTLPTLTNKETLKKEIVEVSNETMEYWGSKEGVDKLINRYSDTHTRQDPIVIEDNYYLGLIYIDKDEFKLFQDIDELPDSYDRNKVQPITLTQLLYCSIYAIGNNMYGLATRYPVTGPGSTHPCNIRVKTTNKSFIKYELDENWERIEGTPAIDFPNTSKDATFMDSMSVHPGYLERLGGDHDGDTMSLEICWSPEGNAAIKKHMRSRLFVVGTDGTFNMSLDIYPVKLALHNMTGDVNDAA